jgi:hypothetical protein
VSSAGLSPPGSSAVGIIVNPNAGKDIRRLTSASGQTSDAVKIGIMRRAAAGALEMGAARILFSSDTHHLAERAVEGLAGPGVIEFLDTPLTGSHLDTIAAARTMWKEQVGAVIALGGDGTCRDVATGWPDVPLIAISTGTNNVFPSAVDGTTAGVAAALVATGAVPVEAVSCRAKRVALRIESPTSVVHEHALVEAALIDTAFVGARAVNDPTSIRWVVACIANPASTGLASVAGRVHPVDRNEPGGVLIRLGTGGRRVRVPLAPGTFTTLDVESVEPLEAATTIDLPGGGILAFDGERTTPVSADSTVTVSVESSGPRLLDVDTTLAIAAGDRRFDVAGTPDDGAPDDGTPRRKDTHGD